jgi:hypothetical protein
MSTGRTQIRSKHCLLLAVAVSAILVALASAAENLTDGDIWLHWSRERRQAFVDGYIVGYYRGHLNGCQDGAGEANKPAADFLSKCFNRRLGFSVETGLYEEQITKFYTLYPENRNLSEKYILEALAGNLTIEEIHKTPPYPINVKPLKFAKPRSNTIRQRSASGPETYLLKEVHPRRAFP